MFYNYDYAQLGKFSNKFYFYLQFYNDNFASLARCIQIQCYTQMLKLLINGN